MSTILDTRCYNCVKMPDGPPSEKDDFAKYDYQGKGIWKCPRCGYVWDQSKNVYDVRLKATIDPECIGDETPWIDFEIIEPFDPRILVKPRKELSIKRQMEQDLPEYQEDWWDGSEGVFDCEILFVWVSSGYYVPIVQSYSYPYLMGINLIFFGLSVICGQEAGSRMRRL